MVSLAKRNSVKSDPQDVPQKEGLASYVGLGGLYLYTFGAVTLRFTDLPFASVGIFLACAGIVLQKQRLRFPPFMAVYLAFVLWCFLSALVSDHSDLALDQCTDRLKLCVIVFMLVNTIRSERDLWRYLMFFLVCFMLFPARGTLQGYAAGNKLFGRAIWNKTYSNPNDLAALTFLTCGFAMAVLHRKGIRPYILWFCWLSIASLAVIILLTQSRGMVIGAVIVIFPLVFSILRKHPSKIIYVVLAGAALAVAIPATVWERLAGISKLTSTSTIADADPEGSANQRFEIQKVALRIFVDHPVFGVGLGAYPLENAIYAPDLGPRDTHNTYLNLAAEVGLPGLLLWLLMIVVAFRSRKKNQLLVPDSELEVDRSWISRAVLGFLIAGFFGTYSALNILYLTLGMMACITGSDKARVPARGRSV